MEHSYDLLDSNLLRYLATKENKSHLESEQLFNLLETQFKGLSVFNSLGSFTRKEKIDICQQFRYEKVPAHSLLIKQGTSSNLKLYLVVSGTVEVYKTEGRGFLVDANFKEEDIDKGAHLDEVFFNWSKCPERKDLVHSKRMGRFFRPGGNDMLSILNVSNCPLSDIMKNTGFKPKKAKTKELFYSNLFLHMSHTVSVNLVKELKDFLIYLESHGLDTVLESLEAESPLSPVRHPSKRGPQWGVEQSPPVLQHYYRRLFGKFVRGLGGGTIIGERALEEDQHIRSATVIAVTDVECFTLNKDAYDRFLKKKHRESREAKFESMVLWFPRLRAFDKEMFWQYQYSFKEQVLDFYECTSKLLIDETSPRNEPFIIREGEVRLYFNLASGAVEQWIQGLKEKFK